MTDAGLLAEHMIWAATATGAGNEAYNIVNGDIFRWRWMWPKLAAYFGVEPVGFDAETRPLEAQMEGWKIPGPKSRPEMASLKRIFPVSPPGGTRTAISDATSKSLRI